MYLITSRMSDHRTPGKSGAQYQTTFCLFRHYSRESWTLSSHFRFYFLDFLDLPVPMDQWHQMYVFSYCELLKCEMDCRWVYDFGEGLFLQCFFPGIFFFSRKNWATNLNRMWVKPHSHLKLRKSVFCFLQIKSSLKTIMLVLKVWEINPCNIL